SAPHSTNAFAVALPMPVNN
uniref:Uncharacterized protein n=1 Tax=Amphimedon queenslandica TaxID=400682 RepID=A0A1X7VEK9_AMPQE